MSSEERPGEMRALLVMAAGEVPAVFRYMLQRAGWQIVLTRDPAVVRMTVADRRFNAGLVLIDRSDADYLGALEETLLIDARTQWVALVFPQMLREQAVCDLLSEAFFDYHTMPIDPERLLMILGHAYGKGELHGRQKAAGEETGKHLMIGTSAPMRSLYQSLEKVACDDAPVLITGESGTGKEAAARAVHSLSVRHAGPLVPVNCGAIPSNLVQSELFGHEKGAFTGAHARKIGRIESAQGGTIFLDEVGDLPPELQVNLLRFLQEKRIARVGSNVEIPVDARVIAATHVDLEKAVSEGRFREDLYYRLNVLNVQIPPLRERDGDIELLAHAYLEKFASSRKALPRAFSRQALHAMRQHRWPGNVRELINRVRRALVMGENRFVTPRDLGLDYASEVSPIQLPIIRDQAEQEVIRRTLRQTQGNMSEAARRLCISRSTLYRRLRRLEPE